MILGLGVATLLFLPPSHAYALTGNEYVMSAQSDNSFLCPTTWHNCFASSGTATINLGPGSNFDNGSLKSVTIAKD